MTWICVEDGTRRIGGSEEIEGGGKHGIGSN